MDAKLVDDQSGVHFVDWLKTSQQLLYYMTQSQLMKVSPAKLENSEATNVLWLVCASCHNSLVTILESTMLIHNVWRLYFGVDYHYEQGLRASSRQFTFPLEFNAIFREGFTLQHELTAGSEIRDPVPAKFEHVTNIVTCTFLCCDYVTYVPALKFPKSWLRTLGYRQKIHHFFLFPQMGHSLQIFV